MDAIEPFLYIFCNDKVFKNKDLLKNVFINYRKEIFFFVLKKFLQEKRKRIFRLTRGM